jgi:hypothetical protein
MTGRWTLPALRFRIALGIHGSATVALVLACLPNESAAPVIKELVVLTSVSIAYCAVLSGWASVCRWLLPTAAGRLFWLALVVPALFHSALVELPSLQNATFALTTSVVEGFGP